MVLDHVLSPSECQTLLQLAEQSVPENVKAVNEGNSAWSLALVNVGSGYEVLQRGYRNGERIVWDCKEVVDKIWARCWEVEGVRQKLAVIGGKEEKVVSWKDAGREGEWRVRGMNERMRFLKYGVGGFFRRRCPPTDWYE